MTAWNRGGLWSGLVLGGGRSSYHPRPASDSGYNRLNCPIQGGHCMPGQGRLLQGNAVGGPSMPTPTQSQDHAGGSGSSKWNHSWFIKMSMEWPQRFNLVSMTPPNSQLRTSQLRRLGRCSLDCCIICRTLQQDCTFCFPSSTSVTDSGVSSSRKPTAPILLIPPPRGGGAMSDCGACSFRLPTHVEPYAGTRRRYQFLRYTHLPK